MTDQFVRFLLLHPRGLWCLPDNCFSSFIELCARLGALTRTPNRHDDAQLNHITYNTAQHHRVALGSCVPPPRKLQDTTGVIFVALSFGYLSGDVGREVRRSPARSVLISCAPLFVRSSCAFDFVRGLAVMSWEIRHVRLWPGQLQWDNANVVIYLGHPS